MRTNHVAGVPLSIRLGMVADDLTGGMDTGVQFVKRGIQTVIMLEDAVAPPAEMVVISTDSRHLPPEQAYLRAREAALLLGDRLVYKKIDSTLRGNVGAEIDGIMDAAGLSRALVAPAFPDIGRTTVDGCVRVHGTLLAESPFSGDPLWPVNESHLPTLLARQTRRSVGYLPLDLAERGAAVARQGLEAERASIVVADAVETRHLRVLAEALAGMEEEWLAVGSGGLAEEWPWGIGGDGGKPAPWAPLPRPVLVLAGSRHPATMRQLELAARDRDLHLVHLQAGGGWRDVAEEAMNALARGQDAALTSTFSEYREGAEPAVTEALARAAAWIVTRVQLAGIFATGGDIARGACRVLGAAALSARGEVQPGVVTGELIGGRSAGLRIVTKAGGFGDELAILRSIDRLRGIGA